MALNTSASEDFKSLGVFLDLVAMFSLKRCLLKCVPPCLSQISGDWLRLASTFHSAAGLWLGHAPAGFLGEWDILIWCNFQTCPLLQRFSTSSLFLFLLKVADTTQIAQIALLVYIGLFVHVLQVTFTL